MLEEGSDDTEVRTSTVEMPEEVDVPEKPEAWDSGSERGDDMEFEPDDDEEGGSDPGDEERMKTRGGGTPDRNLQWCCRHQSVRGCAIYSRGRGWLAGKFVATMEWLRALTRRFMC